MRRRFPIRVAGVVAATFVAGLVGGFLWSLLHRRAQTDYPELLARQRQRIGEDEDDQGE